jgi:hypothetical protein
MKNCILCGKPTEGSVGAAGLIWRMICQPCKNEEDMALLHRIQRSKREIDAILSVVGDNHPVFTVTVAA